MTETTEIKKQMAEKIEVVDNIKNKVSEATAFYIAKYDGVNVENITKLRRELRQNDAELIVYKNKLFKKAIAGTEIEENFGELLKGPNATAFSYGDGAVAAKVLFNFAKDNKELEIKGCIFENKFFGPDKIAVIKDLPTRDGLYSMIASVLNEPMAKLARTLDALREKKESEG